MMLGEPTEPPYRRVQVLRLLGVVPDGRRHGGGADPPLVVHAEVAGLKQRFVAVLLLQGYELKRPELGRRLLVHAQQHTRRVEEQLGPPGRVLVAEGVPDYEFVQKAVLQPVVDHEDVARVVQHHARPLLGALLIDVLIVHPPDAVVAFQHPGRLGEVLLVPDLDDDEGLGSCLQQRPGQGEVIVLPRRGSGRGGLRLGRLGGRGRAPCQTERREGHEAYSDPLPSRWFHGQSSFR